MRRRVLAVAAVVVALAVVSPELTEPIGATTTRSVQRTELQTRPAARSTMTPAQLDHLRQYIKTHPQTLTKTKKKTRRVRVKKRRTRRKVSRKTRIARRKRAAKKRKAKRKAQARKRKARRGSVVAKQRRAKNNKQKKNKKKAGSSSSKSLIDWLAIMFLIALPFIAVALLLFGTDYRRRPRAPSNKKRRGVLVVTPVGRKY